jgi:hypothetical protein
MPHHAAGVEAASGAAAVLSPLCNLHQTRLGVLEERSEQTGKDAERLEKKIDDLQKFIIGGLLSSVGSLLILLLNLALNRK